LHEIDEHHAVQHQRGIPFAVGKIGDAADEVEKGFVLGLELVIEALGDTLNVKRCPCPCRDIHQRKAAFLIEGEGDCLQLLQEAPIARYRVPEMLRHRSRLAGLPPRPAPNLLRAPRVGEDHQMFQRGSGDLMLYLLADGAVGDLLAARRLADPRHHATLLGHCLQREGRATDSNLKRCVMPVPAEFI
jgi:hypothetical protein